MTHDEIARFADLRSAATERCAEVAGKFVPIEKRKGRKRVTYQVPAIDHAYLGVDPADIRWLVDQARPTSEADTAKVAELRAGITHSNPDAEELYLLAKDVALLCSLVPADPASLATKRASKPNSPPSE